MKGKLSKSNVSSHEINSFHEIQYCLRNPHIRMHSIQNIRLGCFNLNLRRLQSHQQSIVRRRQRVSSGLIMLSADVADLRKFQKL